MNDIDKFRFRREHPDLVRAASINILSKIVIAAVWYGFIAYACFYYGSEVVTNREGSGLLFYIAMAVMLYVPFGAFKIHHVVTDRNWTGTVVKIEHLNKLHLITLKPEPVGIVHVRRDDGKAHKITFRNRRSKSADCYLVNETVIHHRGLKYCEKADKLGQRYTVCLRCGHFNLKSQKRSKCDWCKHTLV